MNTNSIEKDFPGKGSESKITKGSSSSRQWSGLKDPRVVRVSRSFGGKDRHSKVCTIRGLRDRRVRLSVPTAIQLYDLQDRLGLNQPSKVVDWLLNVAKHEIDQLPPLPIPPGNFPQFPHQPTSFASLVDAHLDYVKDEPSLQSSQGGFKINANVPTAEDQPSVPKSTYWNLNDPSRSEDLAIDNLAQKSNWIKRNELESQGGFGLHDAQLSSHSSLPRASNNPSFSGLLNNMMPYNSYYHWDPSNLSLSSHLGSHGFSIQSEDSHNYNVVPMPSPLALSSASQLLLCPSGTTTSFFSPYVSTQLETNPSRQINHLQMLSSTSQNPIVNSLQPIVRPIQLGLTPNLLTPQNHIHANQSNKGSGAPSGSFT